MRMRYNRTTDTYIFWYKNVTIIKEEKKYGYNASESKLRQIIRHVKLYGAHYII